MADYISGSIHFTGLGNGTDFDTMISQLKEIEMMPAKRLLKWKADWQKRVDAFQQVRAKLVELKTAAEKMNSVEKFLVKTAESSSSSVASAVAKSNAQTGTYRVEVAQVATNAYWSLSTGFTDANAVVNSSGEMKNFAYQYKGKSYSVSVPSGTTLKSLENLINNDTKNPGVKVSLINAAGGYTFQMRGMDTGTENSLYITQADLNGFSAPGSATYSTGLTSPSDIVNNTGGAVNYQYSYNGVSRTVSVSAGATLEDFVGLINSDPANTTANGKVTATLSVVDGKQQLVLTGDPALGRAAITAAPNTDLTGITTPSSTEGSYKPYTAQYNTNFTSTSDVVNAGSFTYSYSYNGTTRNLSMGANSTLQDLADAINNDASNPGVTASLVLQDGKYALVMTGKPELGGTPITSATDKSLSPGLGALTSTYAPETSPAGWHIQQSQNSKFRINGWPVDYMETSSNTVEDVAEGMTFTLKDKGSTTITVATDKEKIKENVLSFLEAINNVRATILELTKYDDTKTTYSQEVATSLYEMQKGSILTGNYGVQLLSSQLKQATAGTPKGFAPLVETMLSDGSSFWTGDIFSSLSQMGIKTMAEGQSGSANFGMLVLNTDPDLPTLDKVLDVNPEAVAEFFGATNLGKSDSSSFSFSSQITSITKPGIYNVSYTVDPVTGLPSGTINGKEAKYYADTGEFGITNSQPSSDHSNLATATFTGAASATHTIEVTQLASGGTLSFDREFASKDEVISTTEQTFSFSIGNAEYDSVIKADETLEQFVTRINSSSGPIKASMEENGSGKWELKFTTKATGSSAEITGFTGGAGLGTAGTPEAGKNAEYTLDGVAKTSATNTISKDVPGWTFNLVKAEPGTTVTLKGQAFNDADGIMIRLDDLTPNVTHSGNIRIKQGKVNELLTLLNGPPGKSEEGMLGKNGALGILDRNYKTIMDNIQKKVEREDARIVKWERLTRLRFARLEATLSTYDNLSKSTEAQIKQLNSNSS